MDAKEALIETYRELLGLLEEEQRQSEHSFRGMILRAYGELLRNEYLIVNKTLHQLYEE